MNSSNAAKISVPTVMAMPPTSNGGRCRFGGLGQDTDRHTGLSGGIQREIGSKEREAEVARYKFKMTRWNLRSRHKHALTAITTIDSGFHWFLNVSRKACYVGGVEVTVQPVTRSRPPTHRVIGYPKIMGRKTAGWKQPNWVMIEMS